MDVGSPNEDTAGVAESDKVIAAFAGWLETKMITLHCTLALKPFDVNTQGVFFVVSLSLASSCSSSFGPHGT